MASDLSAAILLRDASVIFVDSWEKAGILRLPTPAEAILDNITKDPAYNAVDPHDFPAMLDVNRYGQRSTAFDKIISATHDHFWDPLDKKYIDFAMPFDMENEYLVNPALNGDLKTAIGDKLDERGKI